MRSRLLVSTLAATALALSGCVGVLSHSYDYTTVTRRPSLSLTDWTGTLFHLTEPLTEDLVVDLTQDLEKSCAGVPLENVQTQVWIREFIVFQIYSVRLSGSCSAALAPARAPG